MFKRFIDWFLSKTTGPKLDPSREALLPRVQYSAVTKTATPPPISEVERGIVFAVARGDSLMWAMLVCPCGCQEVITLSLQQAHHPHWRLGVDAKGLPSIWPSIWRTQGCRSHFWLERGRIFWA